MEMFKELPNNQKAEQELLAYIMTNDIALSETLSELEVEDFYLGRHQLIYSTISSLYAVGSSINQITLCEALGTENLKKITVSYISDLITNAIYVEHKDLIKIIKEKSKRRKLIKECRKAEKLAFEEDKRSDDITAELEMKLNERKNDSKVVDDEFTMFATFKSIEERCKNKGQISGMRTGWKGFDFRLKGIQKKKLYVVGGAPGMGKSAFCLNMAEGLANNNNKVLYFSLEMDEEECGIRRMSAGTMIEATKLELGVLSDSDIEKMSKFASLKTSKNNFYSDYSPYQTITSIISKCKALKKSKGLDVVFVDHLGLIDKGDVDDAVGMSEQLGRFTWTLKQLAEELDIAVVVLSQLKTGSISTRNDKRPFAYDIEGSKKIEQNANVILMCYRDIKYNEEADPEAMEILVRKFRGGMEQVIDMKAKLQYYKIFDPANF